MTTNIPAAFQEVAGFNFRHSIGPAFGLHTHREHDQLSAVVIPLGIEHRFQRANIVALSLEARGTQRARRECHLVHSFTRDEKRRKGTASAVPVRRRANPGAFHDRHALKGRIVKRLRHAPLRLGEPQAARRGDDVARQHDLALHPFDEPNLIPR